jgi:hypothetical protein
VTHISEFGGRGNCDDQPWNDYWVCGCRSARRRRNRRNYAVTFLGPTARRDWKGSRLKRKRSRQRILTTAGLRCSLCLRQRTRLSPGSTFAKCPKADWRRGCRISLHCWLCSPPLTIAADRASVVLSPPAGRQSQAFPLLATAADGPFSSASKERESRRRRVARPLSTEM